MKESKSLFQITNDARTLINQLEELNGELTDELELALTLNKENLKQKTDNYYLWIEELMLRQSRFTALILEAKKCEEFYEKEINRMKDRMESTLKTLGMKETIGNLGKFSLVKTRAKVEVLDESLLPAKYLKEKITVSIDKIELGNDLKEKEVPGAMLVENVYLKMSLNNLKDTKEIE